MPPAPSLDARKSTSKDPRETCLDQRADSRGARPSSATGSSLLPAVSPTPPVTQGPQSSSAGPTITFGLSSLPSAISSKRRRTTSPLSSTPSTLDGLVDMGSGSADAALATRQLHDDKLMMLITPGGKRPGQNTAVAGSNDEAKDMHAETPTTYTTGLASSSSAGLTTDAMKGPSSSAARKGALQFTTALAGVKLWPWKLQRTRCNVQRPFAATGKISSQPGIHPSSIKSLGRCCILHGGHM